MDLKDMPPGFRFCPTQEQLVQFYLRPRVKGQNFRRDMIGEVDLYKYEPWDLPEKALVQGSDSEWYFFNILDRKYPRGKKRQRSTKHGYWKITARDRCVKIHSQKVAVKRTLAFHTGKPQEGNRTNWMMYEYQLANDISEQVSQNTVVLCHIMRKGTEEGLVPVQEPVRLSSDNVHEMMTGGLVGRHSIIAQSSVNSAGPPSCGICHDMINVNHHPEEDLHDLLRDILEDPKSVIITSDNETQLNADSSPKDIVPVDEEYQIIFDELQEQYVMTSLKKDTFVCHDPSLNFLSSALAQEDDELSEVEMLEDLLKPKPVSAEADSSLVGSIFVEGPWNMIDEADLFSVSETPQAVDPLLDLSALPDLEYDSSYTVSELLVEEAGQPRTALSFPSVPPGNGAPFLETPSNSSSLWSDTSSNCWFDKLLDANPAFAAESPLKCESLDSPFMCATYTQKKALHNPAVGRCSTNCLSLTNPGRRKQRSPTADENRDKSSSSVRLNFHKTRNSENHPKNHHGMHMLADDSFCCIFFVLALTAILWSLLVGLAVAFSLQLI